MAETRVPGTVVFVDGDWLSAGTRGGQIPLSYAQLKAFLALTFGAEVAVRLYLSTAPESAATQRLGVTLAELGIALHAVAVERGRSDIDMRLALDAMLLPATIATFALVSGDSDFVPLLQRLHEAGRRIVLVSFPLMLSTLLREVADEFVNLEVAVKSRPKPALQRAEVAPTRPASPPAPRPARPRLPSQLRIDKGEHLKPYRFIRNLLVAARRNVSVIDPYIGVELFELFACLPARVGVTIITPSGKKLPPDLCALVERCRKEQRPMRVYASNDFHDRYLRVDDAWWHSGGSFKDLGRAISHLTRQSAESCAAMRALEARTIAAAVELCKPP